MSRQRIAMTTDYDARTALIVVDVQNDFADPRGSLAVGDHEASLITQLNRTITQARRGGAFVVYTQDWHPAHTPHFAKQGGVWPDHCVEETWGAELHPRLVVEGPVVRKGSGGEDGYSGFTTRDPDGDAQRPTALYDLLVERGVARIVVVGLATDYCVKQTALDGVRLGFDVTVPRHAVRAVELKPGDGERALAAVEAAGAHVVP